MAPSCLSFVSLFNKYLNHSLSSAGLISQTISIDSETTIHFYGPKNNTSSKPKSKPPLVLIHGFGPHGMWQWHHQVHFFTTHFNVYIPDLIFFGKSTTKSQNRSEIFQATCVAKLLEKLEVKRYSVVGTSYGGFVAYRMATMWPERVDKVVFASSGVNLRRIDNERLLKRAGNKESIEEVLLPATVGELRTLMGLALFKKPYYMPQFLLNDCIEKLYAENRKEKMELLKGLTLGRDDTVNISPLQQEVLILWGDHDQIFLLEKATELKELLGNKVKLEVIKNSSHMPQLEHPGQFNNIINKFLCGSS